MDTIVDQTQSAIDYAGELTVQLRKGFIVQCVLLVTEHPAYASEIITRLEEAELDVVEGTIYPLLSRLSRDGLLVHQWQESPQGPPRKYYQITDYGKAVRIHLAESMMKLNQVIKNLRKEKSHE